MKDFLAKNLIFEVIIKELLSINHRTFKGILIDANVKDYFYGPCDRKSANFEGDFEGPFIEHNGLKIFFNKPSDQKS